MSIHEKISQSLSKLPDISKENCKVEEFIYKTDSKNNSKIYGCVYADEDKRYMLLKEENANFDSFAFLENYQMNGIKMYYGYIPSFPLAKNIIGTSRTYISWIKDDVIFTLIKIQQTESPILTSLSDVLKDKSFMLVLNSIIDSNMCFGYLPFFEMIKYMPQKIERYKLTTLYLIFSYFTKDPKDILVNIKGNYLHEESENAFINVELGFSYSFSESFQSFCDDFKKVKEICENKTKNYCACSYINPTERFYIKCKNNETSIEFKDEIEKVTKEIVKKMNNYSCIEETMRLRLDH